MSHHSRMKFGATPLYLVKFIKVYFISIAATTYPIILFNNQLQRKDCLEKHKLTHHWVHLVFSLLFCHGAWRSWWRLSLPWKSFLAHLRNDLIQTLMRNMDDTYPINQWTVFPRTYCTLPHIIAYSVISVGRRWELILFLSPWRPSAFLCALPSGAVAVSASQNTRKECHE